VYRRDGGVHLLGGACIGMGCIDGARSRWMRGGRKGLYCAGVGHGRCAAPVASYTLPLNGAASGSSSVTITGLSFGAFGFTPSAGVVSGSELCSTASWSSGTAVQCRSGVPTTLSSQSHAVVTVSGVVGTRGSRFTFDGRFALAVPPPPAALILYPMHEV
jgi:hypothetical protein